MITLIDIIVLMLAYAGISLSCGALMWLLRTNARRRNGYEDLVPKRK